MRSKAVIRLRFSSERHLRMVLKALEPELKKPATMRSRASLEKDGTFLVLKVEAQDIVAIRATLNAYLRWINSATNVLEILEKQ